MENAEHYTWGASCEGWHILRSDSLSVIQEHMPPGTSEELHCHEFAQQVFYILTGKAAIDIQGKTRVLCPGESIHVPRRTLHRPANPYQEDLTFLVISEPPSHGDRIEIIDYADEYREPIKTLNVEWLEKYFAVEPEDIMQLNSPEEELIDKGGMIFYARRNNGIVGTATLMRVDTNTYELGKMAVTAEAQGHGIGTVLMDHCLTVAKQRSIGRLILYSNTILESALHIYRKYGFVEVELEPGHYRRANIKMEKLL